MSFWKVPRSYKTPTKTRLATYQEVNDNLESIKQQGLLEGRDIARLLDGWISGPDFKFEIGDNFRYCMGYMLVIEVYPEEDGPSDGSGKELYEGVSLSEEGKQVALLLCAYDWNFEVVYWLLNSWDTAGRMDPVDVRDGRIPFNNVTITSEMNELIKDLAKNLCETSEFNESKEKLALGSVTDMLRNKGSSSVKKLTKPQNNDLLGRTFENYISFFSQMVGNYWCRAFETQRDSATDLWDLMWEHFCTFSVVYPTQTCLGIMMNKWYEGDGRHATMSHMNFFLSSSILYYITLLHRGFLFDEKQGTYDIHEKFIRITCDKKFNALDQILLVAVKQGDVISIKKMLDCGARALSETPKKPTALHVAFQEIDDEDKLKEVLDILMNKCTDVKEQLINAQDEKGKTVLHSAALEGKANMCEVLIGYGAKQDIKDDRDRLPLHYAVEEKMDEAIHKLISLCDQDQPTEMLTIRDRNKKSPLDLAVDQKNIKLMTKLLPILKQTIEPYYDKVDMSELLRQFALEGSMDIVRDLLKKGACPLDVDEEGKTALHYAALCENYSRGIETIGLILDECRDCQEELVSKRDNKGKTALHAMAKNGIPYLEMDIFEGSVDVEDMDGRRPLFDATEGELDEPDTIDVIMELMCGKDMSLDNMVDNSGLTPLHVAASLGKTFQVDRLLRWLDDDDAKLYVKKADYQGQTALHKAAKGGHVDTIKVLLHWGAQPLLERDCDGKTALHYAVQAKTGKEGIALAELLLNKCGSKERKLLFLWASAAGIGRADQNVSDPTLREFLVNQRDELTKGIDNLLQTAALMGDTEMTKELLRSGCQIASVKDKGWIGKLIDKEKSNVEKVLHEIETIAEQGNDRPSILDNLGRAEFAHGLAALLLNPYLKPPITIGITGSWGMGKSSLMLQTEIILLKTVAQSALLPTWKSPSSNLPGVQKFELSKVGQNKYNKIKRWVDFLRKKPKCRTSFICPIFKSFQIWIGAVIKRKSRETQEEKEEDSLVKFLNTYEPENHKIFKSLAAIDSSDMFIPGPKSYSGSDSPQDGGVPAIVTVQYNAWKYQNESEALAGMAVEITKEMEGIMTGPQWLSTCLRNAWRKQKQTIFIAVIFPCLLAIFLAGAFTWIVWILLDRYNVKEGKTLTYASLPATVVITVWTVVKSVMSVVNPVSSQLMNYIKFPDHAENLGYQERVISDITFLKGEIRRKPFFLCRAASCIWHLITRCCLISYLCPDFCQEDMGSGIVGSTSAPYERKDVRIIVFVDDLDRCEESVILQVLSAINLVLAVCEISAVVGMDKALIQRAIINRYGDDSVKNRKELVDKYLQKIIQLPLDLPDPSEYESKTFLERQLGVFSKEHFDEKGVPEPDSTHDSNSEDQDYNALFSTFEIEDEIEDLAKKLRKMFSSDAPTPDDSEPRETEAVIQMGGEDHPQTDASNVQVAIDVTNPNDANTNISGDGRLIQSEEKAPGGTESSDQSSSPSIEIRKMLFVRYSEGEQDAFRYFETMDTDWRKLPRQWKCLLYYHRLIWYIFSMSNDAKYLDGWQVQLITWIFLCWEWEENINILIQNWDGIGILKTWNSQSKTVPSLRAIVKSYIEGGDEDANVSYTGDDKHKTEELKGVNVYKKCSEDIKAEKSQEDSKGKGVPQNMENSESRNREPVQLEATEENGMETMVDYHGDVATEKKDVSSDNQGNKTEIDKLNEVAKGQMISATHDHKGVSEKLDDVVKTLRNEIERALIELAELRKEIRDLKETKQQTEMNNKSDEKEQMRQKKWQRMQKALKRYDVSMEGIQAFQRFRFHCVPGYLPWPLPKEESEES